MNIYKQLAEKLIGGQKISNNSGQFDCEEAYLALDKIQNGFEIEDPNNLYTEDDKLDSAIGTLASFYTEEEARNILKKA